MSENKQRDLTFSNGIDHRVVAVSKAVEDLNSAFAKFANAVARLDSVVLVTFDPVGLKFDAETSFNVSNPSEERSKLSDCNPVKDIIDKFDDGMVSTAFTTNVGKDRIIGVLTQGLDADRKKVPRMHPVDLYGETGTDGLFHFNDLSKDLEGITSRFFLNKKITDTKVGEIEDQLIYNQDIISYSNFVVKGKSKEDKGKTISINALENFHVTLETWNDLSQENSFKKDEKELFLHTMEGMRLFLEARKTETVYPAGDLNGFLAQNQVGKQGFTLLDIVHMSNPTDLTPDNWKVLKPLFTQYLIKQTGTAFAGLLRSFWKPSKMEKLKAEAVSSFETKPQNKGNLGNSKQKKGPKPGPKEGKSQAKDKGKDPVQKKKGTGSTKGKRKGKQNATPQPKSK